MTEVNRIQSTIRSHFNSMDTFETNSGFINNYLKIYSKNLSFPMYLTRKYYLINKTSKHSIT